MRPLVLNGAAIRALRRFRKRHSDLTNRLDRVLTLMQDDLFHPSLRTHRLQGELGDLWSCSVTFEYRILFELVAVQDSVDGAEEIHMITIGTHDEVY